MKNNKTRLVLAGFALALLAGCASIANDQAVSTESELSAAGFQMKLADTPAKLAHITGLNQRKLFPTRKDGNLVFVYADMNWGMWGGWAQPLY